MSNKIRLSSNAFFEALAKVPAEDWYRNWPADRTIMLSMTSKKIRNIINIMCIPAIVHWKWKFWSDRRPQRDVSIVSEVKLDFIMKQLEQMTTSYLYKITTLVLRCCDIQQNVEKLEKVLKMCPMLEKLDLQRNGINAEGVIKIAKGLEQCPELLHLNLYNNKIGDEGAIEITELLKLKYCPKLSYLNFSFNKITDKGVMKLAKVIIESDNQVGALNDIELTYNRITEDGMICLVKMLIKCPNIKNLNLNLNFSSNYCNKIITVI